MNTIIKPEPTEEQIQKAFVEWARLTPAPSPYEGKIGDYLFHAPSEGKRSLYFGSKLKKLGWSAGFPDIAIFIKRKGYGGLFLEFKSKTGKLTKEQISWGERLSAQDYLVRTVRSFEEAVETTKNYLFL